MITLQQAINLATKAHEGQWRRDKVLTYSQVKKIAGVSTILNKQEFRFNDDSQILWDDLNNKYIYKVPYITHPLAVMDMMSTEEEKIVAVLHDVIEDTEAVLINKSKTTNRWYIKLGNEEYKLSEPIRCALATLTHDDCISYKQYIKEVSENKLATKVKIADMFHNLSDNPSEHSKNKYLKAIPILLGVI